jgi:hypothetical protein
MGEVYRARDEHWGRDAPTKILPVGTRGYFSKETPALGSSSTISRLKPIGSYKGGAWSVFQGKIK